MKKTNLVKALFTSVLLAAVLAGCEGPLDTGAKNAARNAGEAAPPQIVGFDIGSAAEFNEIGRSLPADGDYVLTDNIVLVDRDPVEFNGTFDGDGFTITLNSFASSALAYSNLGIFTAVNTVDEPAWVKNLTIEVNVDTLNPSGAPLDTTAAGIGMLAGSAAGAEFDNITVLPISSSPNPGPLAITDTNTAMNATIEAGSIIGSMTKSSISNSTSNLAITATTTMAMVNSFSRFGGIVGAAYAGVPDPVTGSITTISNCENTGFISLTTNANNPCVGGIAGYTNSGAVVELCRNTGNVTLTGTGALVTPYSGGIAGRHTNGSTISQSYAACNVVTQAPASSFQITAGGIAGTMRNEQNNQTDESHITDCYFRGDVTATSETGSRNPAMAGGIVGFIYTGGSGETRSGIVTNCYATGTVIGDSENGAAAAGGIAGNLQEAHAAVRTSVALNNIVSIIYTMTGQWTGVHRVIGFVTYGDLIDANNRAWANMRVYDNSSPVTPIPDDEGEDGANTINNPPLQAEYIALGWTFPGTWTMGGDGFPILTNRP
jgi:hypothetical protein